MAAALSLTILVVEGCDGKDDREVRTVREAVPIERADKVSVLRQFARQESLDVPLPPTPTLSPVLDTASGQDPRQGPDTDPVSTVSPEPVADLLPSEVRVTHYFCVGDGTGAYCGNTASGRQVFAGAAACHRALMGYGFSVGGFTFECVDTGGLVGWSNIDIWCYSAYQWGWPGTPEAEAPCPVPSGWQEVSWE